MSWNQSEWLRKHTENKILRELIENWIKQPWEVWEESNVAYFLKIIGGRGEGVEWEKKKADLRKNGVRFGEKKTWFYGK
jgi:hypothetical protein